MKTIVEPWGSVTVHEDVRTKATEPTEPEDEFAKIEALLADEDFWTHYNDVLVKAATPMFEQVWQAGARAGSSIVFNHRGFEAEYKHLPNKHDQSTHGRGGSRAGGSDALAGAPEAAAPGRGTSAADAPDIEGWSKDYGGKTTEEQLPAKVRQWRANEQAKGTFTSEDEEMIRTAWPSGRFLTYEKGNVTVKFNDPADMVRPDSVKLAMYTVDDLTTKFPNDRGVEISFTARMLPVGGSDAYGITVRSPAPGVRNQVMIRQDMMHTQGFGMSAYQFSKAASNMSALEYTIVHEYGHSLDKLPDSVANSYTGGHMMQTSNYAAQNVREGFAEAFTEYYHDKNVPQRERVQSSSARAETERYLNESDTY